MADYDHYEIQTRQRLTSSDLNKVGNYVGKAAIELGRRLVNRDRTSVSGVIDGLRVTVIAASMNVSISGGLALLYDATQVTPNNRHRWIEIDDLAPETATLAIGGVTPRWDVIEIEPGVADGPGDVLDIYDPALGVPVAVGLFPLKLCTPTITVRQGTPGAAPKFPAGVAGRIPLAYVYVAAGAVALNADRVVYCRPMLRPAPGSLGAPNAPARATGGGWWRTLSALTGNLAADMHGNFRSGAEFYLPSGSGYNLSSSGNFDGGGLPIANGTVYLYAAPPPYPTGYDSNLAPREIYIVDSTVMSATYVSGAYGAVIVASLVAPKVSAVGSPVTAGTCTITDNLFGTIGIDHADMIYIGTSYFLLAGGTLYAQRSKGAIGSALVQAGNDLAGLFPIAATAISFASSIAGDGAYALPAHVSRIRVVGYFKLGLQGDLTIQFQDHFSMDPVQVKTWTAYRSVAMADLEFGCDMWLDCVFATQQVTVLYAAGNSLTATAKLRVTEFEDSVLALR